MIKKILLIFFILIINSSFVHSELIDINPYKINYNIGETFQAEIIINTNLGKDIQTSNIKLLKDGNIISLPSNLIKISDKKYFISYDIPQLNTGEYKFGIFGVYYYEDEILKNGEFSKTISISQEKKNILSIKPAYYKRTVKDYDESPFSLIINNNGENSVNVIIESTNDFINVDSKKFTLNPGAKKTVNINTILYNKEGNKFEGNINIKYAELNYKINILIDRIITQKQIVQNTTVINNTNTNVVVEQQKVHLSIGDSFGGFLNNISLKSKKDTVFNADLAIINNGNNTINNIELKVNGNVKDITKISINNLSTLNAYGIYPIIITINKDKNLDKDYSGSIILSVDSKEVYSIPLNIYFEKEVVRVINNTFNQQVNTTIPIIKLEETKSNLFVWILLIVIVFMLLLLIFYLYFKGKTKKEDEFGEFVQRRK